MEFKKALIYLTVALVALAGTFFVLEKTIMQIDTATIPEPFGGIIVYLQTFFSSGMVATGIVWFRNIWGYVRRKAQKLADGERKIEYNFMKLGETAAYYVGSIGIIFQAAPTVELRAIGTVAVFLLDVFLSELSHMFATL